MLRRVVDLGVPVHFLDFGGSGPPMVLVHGLGGSAINWLGVGPALARGHHVVALDLAGFGETPPVRGSAGLATQRDLLGRFLASVIGAPAVLVGNSMGGLLALMQAASGPEHVSRLVLAAPAQPTPRRGRIDLEILAAFATYAMPWLGPWYMRRRAARLGPEGLVREMLRICCVDPSRVSPDLRAAHVELAAERLARMPWATDAFLDATRSLLSALRRRRRFYAMVARIDAPGLIIQGTGDRLVPMAASRELARRRPDWTMEVLDGIGHVPQLEAPAHFVAAAERWLGRAA
jgi:pimeloyl-ACP methyl ester carboxylesterase